MDLVVVFALFVFMLALLCFCFATGYVHSGEIKIFNNSGSLEIAILGTVGGDAFWGVWLVSKVSRYLFILCLWHYATHRRQSSRGCGTNRPLDRSKDWVSIVTRCGRHCAGSLRQLSQNSQSLPVFARRRAVSISRDLPLPSADRRAQLSLARAEVCGLGTRAFAERGPQRPRALNHRRRQLLTGWSDVTESVVTIRSPFCGYNTI